MSSLNLDHWLRGLERKWGHPLRTPSCTDTPTPHIGALRVQEEGWCQVTDLTFPNQLQRPWALLGAELQGPAELGLGLGPHLALYERKSTD